jgi:hypothetical protein
VADPIILPADWPVRQTLERLVAGGRILMLAGLPGVGKSLLVQQISRMAQRLNRPVFLLQWDVARGAFETPPILARYPEVNGFTHAAVKRAAGLWSRGAVHRWHQTAPPAALLLAETPLVGGRLMELASPRLDDAEPLLASEAVQFLVPVPTREVRAAIETARERSIASPRHARERADAAPNVLRALWEDVYRQGRAAAAAALPREGPIPYDPAAYRAVYLAWLRHRRVTVLEIDRRLSARGSVYDIGGIAGELTPNRAEVDDVMREVEVASLEDPRS